MLLVIFIVTVIVIMYTAHKRSKSTYKPTTELIHEPIDLVYTWVNGSDEKWLAEKAKHRPPSAADNRTRRFRDNDEIRYSLRSVEQFAPWIRHIFIVTYDENSYPSFLVPDHPKITIVPHSVIFKNKTHLPTYNSCAIEANIGNIPGLSSRFLYANDDMMFGAPVTKNDFINNKNQMLLGQDMKWWTGWFSPRDAHNNAWRRLHRLLKRCCNARFWIPRPSHHIQIVDKHILNSIFPEISFS